jgi:DNA-binding SARP family transcriptional activator/tetratricopeptide (TPR) repeat protein
MEPVTARVSVFATLQIWVDGHLKELRPQERALMSALALFAPEPVHVARLAGLLWQVPPPTARKAIQNHVARIRTTVGENVIETSPDGYRLGRSVESDRDAVAEIRSAAAAIPDPTERARVLKESLLALRGEMFADLPNVGPVEARRAEHTEQLLQADEDLAVALIEAGDGRAAVSFVDRLVVEAPFRERRWWLYALALYRDGQRRDSLQGFARARRVLADRVGLDPGHDLRALEARILADDSTLMDNPVVDRSGPLAELAPGVALAGHPRFVGRSGEMAAIEDTWHEVISTASHRVVVIQGEAGVGKTRLAIEAALGAHKLGAAVMMGHCSTIGLPYQPIVEVLTHVLKHNAALLDRLGHQAAALSLILPELEHRIPGPSTTSPPAEDGRGRLFQAVGSVFEEITRLPTVWIVDDLQWASDDTLALLGHLLSILAGRPLLVIATTRAATGGVASALADWQRTFAAQSISLDGLDVTDLSRMIVDRTPWARDEKAAAEIMRRRTGGNAFFATELLATAGSDSGVAFDPEHIPVTLRTWIERRRDSLERVAADVLNLASAVGLDIDFDVLRACAGLGDAKLIDVCDLLLRERFVEETGAGRLRFVHSLVRDAIYESLSGIRRSWLHHSIGEVLEATTGAPADVLAYHFAHSGLADAERAYRYALLAGRAALDQGAWATAADLAAQASSRAASPEQTADALVLRGRAQRALGEMDAARESLDAVIDIARREGLGRHLAEGVLALVGGGGRGVAVELRDADRARLLREASDVLGDGDDDLLVRVLSELALALLLTDRIAERDALARRAVEIARNRTDRSDLSGALLSRRLLRMGPDDVQARLTDLDEILALPGAVRPTEVTLAALAARHEDLLAIGRRSDARLALQALSDLADQFAHPYWSWVTRTWQTLEAVTDGRLDEAESLAFAALGIQPTHPEAIACLGVNLVDIRLYQGRAAEVLDLLGAAADENPHVPAYRAVLALCCVEAGDTERAEPAYRAFADDLFSKIPVDTNRLLTLSVLAHVAPKLGTDSERSALKDLLLPWGRQQSLLNCYAGGGAYWGPVSHALAVLEAPGSTREALLDEAERSATSFEAPLAAERIARSRRAAEPDRRVVRAVPRP